MTTTENSTTSTTDAGTTGATDASVSDSTDDATTEETTEDKPLGAAGERALKAEREARKALEAQIKDMAPLMELVNGIRGAVPTAEQTDTEKLAAEIESLKAVAATERSQRLRLEVATAKGLTPAQAARLQGATAEELTADAEALLALFPVATDGAATPVTRGDKAQGARTSGAGGGLEAGAAKFAARKTAGPTY